MTQGTFNAYGFGVALETATGTHFPLTEEISHEKGNEKTCLKKTDTLKNHASDKKPEKDEDW